MAISSLFLRSVAAFSVLQLALGAYVLQDDFSGASFFDNFDFFIGPDPTNGFVDYVNEATAQSARLISAAAGQPAVFGVDSTTVLMANGTGRESVRITSKNTYTHALIISDIQHMPGGICGTWPAHWTLGPNWPSNGEIDIIEGVNNADDNLMSLHTTPACTIAGANETGTLQTNDCETGEYNTGCGVTADTTDSYGTGFNSGDGGVYATQWTSAYIRIWFFPRGSIPADIIAGAPDPTKWGLPQANFQGSCDIDAHFADHQIIFDTTFCGDYGNSDWGTNTQCNSLAATCPQYVASNPSAFANAYWSINSVQVYQNNDPVQASTVAAATSSVIPVSSVLAPGMGNSSTPATASATRSGTLSSIYGAATQAVATNGAIAPAIMGAFRYLGCASSTDFFSNFIQIDNNAAMTLEKCMSDCAGYTFVGVFNTLCYCTDILGTTTIISAANICSNPCPGNLKELCGGTATTASRIKRQAAADTLLSLYELDPGSAASTSTLTVPVDFLVSVNPAYQTFAYGMGISNAPVATDLVLTTTYIDICTLCADGYTSVPYTTTILHCGCVANEASTIAMTAVETACASCGNNGAATTVTVTIPAAIAAASGISSASLLGLSPVSALAAAAAGGFAYSNATAVATEAVTSTLANGAVETESVTTTIVYAEALASSVVTSTLPNGAVTTETVAVTLAITAPAGQSTTALNVVGIGSTVVNGQTVAVSAPLALFTGGAAAAGKSCIGVLIVAAAVMVANLF